MSLMKFFKKILGYNEPELTEAETPVEEVKPVVCSNPAYTEKPKKKRRGRPRKKKKEE